MTLVLTEKAKEAARKTLPNYMVQSLFDYFEKGLSPGSFLRAILENDLVGAFANADSTNENYVKAYIQWLWWYVPGRPNGWGSKKAVADWIEAAFIAEVRVVD